MSTPAENPSEDDNGDPSAATAAIHNNNTANTKPPPKIDPITALQEGIDGLSLTMFEALRGLRDAVAPESGNLGNSAATNNNESSSSAADPGAATIEVDEMWLNYCKGDAEVMDLVRESKFNPGGKAIKKREEFIKWHRIVEREKDTELVQELAAAVLEKSDQIDKAVDDLPGMHRNREQQMELIEQLIQENATTMEALSQEHARAKQIRNKCRDFVLKNTAVALGITET